MLLSSPLFSMHRICLSINLVLLTIFRMIRTAILFSLAAKHLGNSSIFIALFIFGLAFSLVPSNIKSRANKNISMVLIFIAFLGFCYVLKDTFRLWFSNGPKTASLIPLGTILFTPIFGNYVDKKGRGASLMILGSLLLIFAHIALSLFSVKILAYLGFAEPGNCIFAGTCGDVAICCQDSS